MITATLGKIDHLTADEQKIARHLAQQSFTSLDRAREELACWLPGWLVYRGGSHVAVHRQSGDDLRVILFA